MFLDHLKKDLLLVIELIGIYFYAYITRSSMYVPFG